MPELLNTTALSGAAGLPAPGAPTTSAAPYSNPAGPDDLMTKIELAAMLRVSLRQVERMEETGQAPPRVQVSARRVAYRRGDVLAWLNARTSRARTAA